MAEEERKPMPLLKGPSSFVSLENGFENVHIKSDPLDITDQNSMEESCINNSDDNEEEIESSLQQPPVNSENNSTPVQKNVDNSSSLLDVAVDINLGVVSSSYTVENEIITPVIISNKFNTLLNSKDSSDLNYFIEYNQQNLDNTLEDSLLLTDNTFSCSFCSFTTDKQKVLGDHEKNHRKTNLPIFQCFYCSQRYTRHMLYMHVQSVHPGQKFQIRDKDGQTFSCFKCLFSTDKEEDLNEHLKTHFSASNSEKTSESGEETSKKTAELEIDTEPQVLDNGKVQCHLCSYVCPNLRDMKFHMNSHRKKLPIIQCSRCPFRSTSNALKYHMRNCSKLRQALKKSQRKAIAKTYRCSKCVFATLDKAELNIHAKIHVPSLPKAIPKTYKCSHCLFATLDKAELDIHAKIHTASLPKPIAKTFKCSQCVFVTTDKAKLNIHAKSHAPAVSSDEQPFRCFKCSFATLDEDIMLEHMQTHINAARKAAVESEAKKTANKPCTTNNDASNDVFKCPKCSFSTDSQYKLNTHLKIHPSPSEPSNKTSQETARQRINLHAKKALYEPIRTLSSDGQYCYRCKLCSYERKNNANFEGHMNSHKLNQPIRKCPNCSFKSTRHALSFHRTKCLGEGESTETTEPSTSSLAEEEKEESETDNELESLRVYGSTGVGVSYQCKLCSYVSCKTTNMRSHLKSHKNNMPIEKCANCPFRSTRRTLQFHASSCKGVGSLPQTTTTKEVPSRGIFKCSQCPYKTKLRVKLKLHAKRHKDFPIQSKSSSGDRLYHCDQCSYKSTKHIALKSHMRLHQLNMPIEKCPNCEFRSTKQALTFHLLKCKAESKEMEENDVADSVDDATESTEDTQDNSSSVEDSQDDQEQADPQGYRSCVMLGRRTFKCDTCSYVTRKRKHMHAHSLTHKLNLPIIDCPKCDFRSTGRVLKYHLKTCNGTSKIKAEESKLAFKCTSCSFSTSLRIKLKSHVRKYHSVVSKIKLFSCKTCSFVTKKRNVYQNHLQSHSLNLPGEEDQMSSTEDDKTSETGTSSKKSDTTTSSSEASLIKWKRGFKCTLCSYTSDLKGSVRRHVAGHKKYNWPIIKCRGCNYKSINLTVLLHEKQCKKLKRGKIRKNVRVDEMEFRTCQYCFGNIKKPCWPNYRLHLEEKHFDKILKQDEFRVFRCADCKFVTLLYGKLTQHQNETEHRAVAAAVDDENEANIDDNGSDKSESKETSKSDSEENENASGSAEKKPIHKCNFCSFTSTMPSGLALHIKSHTHEWKQRIKKCETCDYRSTHHALMLHQRTCTEGNESSKKPATSPIIVNQLKCPLCPLTLSTNGNLKKHVDTVHRDQLAEQDRFAVSRCSQCDFATLYNEKLSLHADEAKHERTDVDEVDARSSEDNSKEENKKLKRRHSQLEESKGKTTNDTTYQCPFCSYVTEGCVNYKSHMDTCHFDKVTEQDKCQVYTCLDCDFASVFISRSVRHREATNHTLSNVSSKIRKRKVRKKTAPINPRSKMIKCTYCSYSCKYRDRFNLTRHMITHTVKKKPIRKCMNCDFKSTPYALGIHERTCGTTKSKVEEFQCVFCSFTSCTASGYKKHLDVMHYEQLSEQDMFEVFGCLNCSFVTIYHQKMMSHRDETKHNFVSGVKPKPRKRFEASKKIVDVSSGDEKLRKPAIEKKKMIFRCTECPFTTYLRIQLNLHVKKYHKRPLVKQKGTIHKCKCCSYTTNRKEHLTRHMLNHDKKMTIEKCAKCDFKSTIKVLNRHEKICDGTQDKEIASEHKPSKKMKISSKNKAGSDGAFRCIFCKFHSFHQGSYKLHMENMHIDKIKEQTVFEVYKCIKCEFGTIYNSKMLRHTAQTNHMYEKLGNNSRAVPPSEKTKYSDNTRDHSSDEDPSDKSYRLSYTDTNDEFSCKKCAFTTAYKNNLKRHMEQRHQKDHNSTEEKTVPKKEETIKPEKQNTKVTPKTEEMFMSSPGIYSCRHCSYTTETKCNLVRHVEAHDKWNLPVEQCPDCEYRSTPRALQCHATKCPGKPKTTPKNEDEAEIFSCNICSYTTHLKTALKRHLNSSHGVNHLPVKQCPNCDFKGTRSVLEDHGPKCPNKTDVKKTLTCTQCPYTTVLPKRMRTHQEEKHPKEKETKPGGPKTFKCEYCSFTSFWQYLIEKHMNSHTLLKLPIESCGRCDFHSTPSALAAHTKICTGKKRDRLSSESSRGSCSSNDIINERHIKKLKLDSPRSDIGLSDLHESGIASNSPSIDERESNVDNNLSDTSSIDKNSVKSTSASNASLASSSSNPKFAFTCPDCPFSTNLRIKLNVHIQKNH